MLQPMGSWRFVTGFHRCVLPAMKTQIATPAHPVSVSVLTPVSLPAGSSSCENLKLEMVGLELPTIKMVWPSSAVSCLCLLPRLDKGVPEREL